jgi:hypothetical protein
MSSRTSPITNAKRRWERQPPSGGLLFGCLSLAFLWLESLNNKDRLRAATKGIGTYAARPRTSIYFSLGSRLIIWTLRPAFAIGGRFQVKNHLGVRDVVAGRRDSAQNESNQVIRHGGKRSCQRLGFEGAPNRGLKAHLIGPDQLSGY